MRKVSFANGEYYHIFNRGVDKREVFLGSDDIARFFQGMNEFNTIDPIGSIYENSFRKNFPLGNPVSKSEKLVDFVCYCLNPNHYHFILRQSSDDGIKKFMHRLGVGYTKYFNKKNKRTGALFQGNYKCVHVDSNEYLLHLSAYVNLNDKVHSLGNPVSKSEMSSWREYVYSNGGNFTFCKGKDIVLGQFNSPAEYKEFAESSLTTIREKKELEKILLE